MKTINLKKYYYPICKKDTFVEVPDEVADAIVEESRAEDANDAKQHYGHALSPVQYAPAKEPDPF